MSTQIKRLFDISQKPSRLIIGLMSGTSLDGLDIALCEVSGTGKSTSVKVLAFDTCEYSDEFKARVKEVFAKEQVKLLKLTLLNADIATTHAYLINKKLDEWGYQAHDIDLIASHGQTVFHAPKSFHKIDEMPNATLQIGDGDHIAAKTGIITISDFRQKQVAHGGEGAPLAMYADYLLFSNQQQNRILLNIGGISNFTYLPANALFKQIVCTDIGPGNTLMDEYAKEHFNIDYDESGNLARTGDLQPYLLDAMCKDKFIMAALPKTTGQEYFNLAWLDSIIQSTANEGEINSKLTPVNILNTLNHFSAKVIASAIKQCTTHVNSIDVYVSGGGYHNTYLLENIGHYLGQSVSGSSQKLGIHPDAKEAVLFALLANETMCSQSHAQTQDSNPVQPWTCMGKISLPK